MSVPKLTLAELKLAIKRAIVVLDAAGDHEMRFLAAGRALNAHDAIASWDSVDRSAIAFNQPNIVKYIPTAREIAQAEELEPHLIWLAKARGKQALRRLVMVAHNVPIWKIADIEDRSEATIYNRINRSVADIHSRYCAESIVIDIVDERTKRGLTGFISEPSKAGNDNAIQQHGKAYIAGVGFMCRGKVLRNGRDKFKECADAG